MSATSTQAAAPKPLVPSKDTKTCRACCNFSHSQSLCNGKCHISSFSNSSLLEIVCHRSYLANFSPPRTSIASTNYSCKKQSRKCTQQAPRFLKTAAGTASRSTLLLRRCDPHSTRPLVRTNVELPRAETFHSCVRVLLWNTFCTDVSWVLFPWDLTDLKGLLVHLVCSHKNLVPT